MPQEKLRSETVYASCSAYALGWSLGAARATALLAQSVAQDDTDPVVPAVVTLRLLRDLAPIALRIDGGATHLAKSRSRHFAAAYHSTCGVWLTVDDDVAADAEAVATVLSAVRDNDKPRVCLAPCLLRGSSGVASVEWSSLYLTRSVLSGGKVRSAVRGGFGLVAMNRKAIDEIARACPWFTDDDGTQTPAPFAEVFDAGRWIGEDLAFFHRLPPTVTVEASLTGHTVHAGLELSLASLTAGA
jgi:hypothetical protein